MKIVFQAFAWKWSNPKFPLSNFLDNMSDQQVKYDAGNRRLYFIKDGKYFSGVILTIKNMKKFVTLLDTKNEITLDVHQLNNNENIADFNFFIVNYKTGFGVYQYYHHSCSLNAFNYILSKLYSRSNSEYINSITEELKKQGATESKIKKEEKQWRSKLTTSIIMKKGSFAEKILQMKDIYGANIEFLEFDILEREFSPLKKELKSVKYALNFNKEKSIRAVLDTLVSIFKKNTLKRATVKGKNELGDDVTYKLFNDFDRFNEFDYDDMVPSLKLDPQNIQQSILNNKIIGELKITIEKMEPLI